MVMMSEFDKQLIEHPHISRNPGIYGGSPIVSGVRFTVADVLGRLATGMTVEEICDTWKLSREAVLDAIAYAQDVYQAILHPDSDEEE